MVRSSSSTRTPGEPLPIHGDGEQTRDYTYIDDAVDATLLAAIHPRAEGEVFNVGTGIETSVNRPRPRSAGARHGDRRPALDRRDIDNIRRRVVNIEKIRRMLRWTPQFTLERGLERDRPVVPGLVVRGPAARQLGPMTDAPGARGPVLEGPPVAIGSLPELYEVRFDEREVSQKDAVWREIVAYSSGSSSRMARCSTSPATAATSSRFVNARERWATDIRDVSASLPPESVRPGPGSELAEVLPTGHFGTVFMSNYLEHLESGEAVIEQLRVAQALRPGGRVVILQPNIRLVGPRYWDFIDHRVALTERSLLEAAEIAGLGTVKLVPRFLPYSTKGGCRRLAPGPPVPLGPADVAVDGPADALRRGAPG